MDAVDRAKAQSAKRQKEPLAWNGITKKMRLSYN